MRWSFVRAARTPSEFERALKGFHWKSHFVWGKGSAPSCFNKYFDVRITYSQNCTKTLYTWKSIECIGKQYFAKKIAFDFTFQRLSSWSRSSYLLIHALWKILCSLPVKSLHDNTFYEERKKQLAVEKDWGLNFFPTHSGLRTRLEC